MDRGAWWAAVHGVATERLPFHFLLSCIGEGNGNPLQCSCLENPRDGGAWWAAVYGVAQSRTQLKRLSSSSRDEEKTHRNLGSYFNFPHFLTWWGLHDSTHLLKLTELYTKNGILKHVWEPRRQFVLIIIKLRSSGVCMIILKKMREIRLHFHFSLSCIGEGNGTPVFLPGESQGQGSLVGCCLWGHTESDMTEVT